MFDIAYPLDDVVVINGKEYTVDMSFDNIMRFYDMMNDDKLTDFEKVAVGLVMLIDLELDYNIEEQYKILLQIVEEKIQSKSTDNRLVDIAGNVMDTSKLKQKDTDEPEKQYDLKQDSNYIYASFMQDYGIDLFEQQGKLHWLKFQSLLTGLTEETKFKKVLEIRMMDLPTGKGTNKEREKIKELKKIYALKP